MKFNRSVCTPSSESELCTDAISISNHLQSDPITEVEKLVDSNFQLMKNSSQPTAKIYGCRCGGKQYLYDREINTKNMNNKMKQIRSSAKCFIAF